MVEPVTGSSEVVLIGSVTDLRTAFLAEMWTRWHCPFQDVTLVVPLMFPSSIYFDHLRAGILLHFRITLFMHLFRILLNWTFVANSHLIQCLSWSSQNNGFVRTAWSPCLIVSPCHSSVTRSLLPSQWLNFYQHELIFLMVYIPLVYLITLVFKLSQSFPLQILSIWLCYVKPLSFWGSVSDIRRYLSHTHLTSLPMPETGHSLKSAASLWSMVCMTEIWTLNGLIGPGMT